MPLIDATEEPLGQVAQLPEPDVLPPATVMGTLGAATRLNNVAGAFFDNLRNPKPEVSPVPGFDPLTSVPKGYEEYADRFLDARSPEEMEWTKNRINDELQDRMTIERAGKWGMAASMAAGLTDPLSLASMAIPGGGETRMGNAVRLALINGGTTAAQEVLMQQLTQTRTAGESMFNVAGSTVLGGILGGVLPHVPSGSVKSLSDRLSTELHTEDGGTRVLGPEQRSVLDTELPSANEPTMAEVELGRLHGEIHEHLSKQEERLRGITEGPEGQSVNLRNDVTQVGERQRTAQEALDEAASRLSESRDVQVQRESQRLAESDQGNDYAQQRAQEAGEEKSVFPKWQQAAEEEVDRSRGQAEEQAELARKVLATSNEDMGRINKVRGAESDLEQLQSGRAKAETPEDLAELLPQGQRESYQRRIASLRGEMKGREPQVVPQPEMAPTDPSEEHINPNAESTAGAAAANQTNLAQETIARGAKTLAEGTIGRAAPGLRLLTSPSIESRKLVQELANTPEMMEKNYSGIATPQPIERKLWGYEGVWRTGQKARAQLFRNYRERVAGSGGEALSRRDFGEAISAAMRRGDEHAIPEVAQAAKETRRIVFDPLKVRAQKLGLLPDEVKAVGADSYLTRQYDARAIRENLGKWLDTLTEGFKAQGVDPAEARDIAHKATRNVLGSERGTMDWHVMDDIVPQSGRLKERTLTLPDHLLEPYLNSDIDHLSHSYLRSMAPEVEMTERFGSRDLRDQIGNINDEYARLMEQAKAQDKDIAPLEKQQRADLRDISAIRDRLYGIYGQPKDPGSFMVRAGKVLRSDNALRLLGAATLAHFPDLANVIARYGMPKTFGAIGRIVTSSSAMSLTRSESQRMGAALDMVMNVTASLLGDFGSHSQFAEQRLMAKVTRGFTIATGETPLITAVQGLTSTLAGDEVLRTAQKVAAGTRISQNQMAKLASSGLDEAMLQRIAKQMNYTQEANGLRFGMSDKWADQGAAQAFESAVLKEAHGVTLRPGAGDTPLFMSGELGKTILQFKTFAFAASRIVVNPLMQGLAHGDPRAIQGLIALAFMGTASYVAKQTAAGQPIETENPRRLAMEVLDKSNLLGWTGEMIFPALWQLGMKDLSRWSDRDPIETLLGPSAGTVASLYTRRLPGKLTADPDAGEKGFARSDLHFLRRLMPGQNLWYFRRGVNATEDAMGDAFDLSGTSNSDRALAANE